mmetsp:Transcript_7601/g.23149  ORF Transcript_7601/g.23149 Transcript_7601/m.23149 type:complete len:203 (+) Transcript_7601:207-815(+)
MLAEPAKDRVQGTHLARRGLGRNIWDAVCMYRGASKMVRRQGSIPEWQIAASARLPRDKPHGQADVAGASTNSFAASVRLPSLSEGALSSSPTCPSTMWHDGSVGWKPAPKSSVAGSEPSLALRSTISSFTSSSASRATSSSSAASRAYLFPSTPKLSVRAVHSGSGAAGIASSSVLAAPMMPWFSSCVSPPPAPVRKASAG